MAYDVTSWWLEQAESKTPKNIVRKFLLSTTSDYSNRVMKWPKIRRTWDEIRPVSINIDLANDDGALNLFYSNPTNLRGEGEVQIGFTHATSGDEMITPFSGKVDKVRYREGAVRITLTDKFKQLSERTIGTDESPQDYTGSDYLVHDLAWYVCTSHGGYSAVESTSNPDIDYAAFDDWRQVFSDDNVRMQAHLEGVKCTEMLRKIARLTQSAIYVEDNKISFKRFTLADSYATTFDVANTLGLTVSVNDDRMRNRQYVSGDYNVDSDEFAITVLDESSASVNSYGLVEETEKDEEVWLVGSVSTRNLAQRLVLTYKEPFPVVDLETTLVALPRQLGETATVVDSQMSMNDTFRIMEQEINLDTGEIEMSVDYSQVLDAFRLDISALDSSDVLL